MQVQKECPPGPCLGDGEVVGRAASVKCGRGTGCGFVKSEAHGPGSHGPVGCVHVLRPAISAL